MIEPPALAFEWLAAGGLVAIAGALVKFRGWTFLLAGYDTTSPVPDDVVKDVAGNTVLRIGIAVFTLGLLASVTDVPSYLNPLVEAAIVLDVLRMIYRLNISTPQLTYQDETVNGRILSTEHTGN